MSNGLKAESLVSNAGTNIGHLKENDLVPAPLEFSTESDEWIDVAGNRRGDYAEPRHALGARPPDGSRGGFPSAQQAEKR